MKAELNGKAELAGVVAATTTFFTDPIKEAWKRPRPHLCSDLVKPVVKLSSSGVYP